jgi:hypothetical protein
MAPVADFVVAANTRFSLNTVRRCSLAQGDLIG